MNILDSNWFWGIIGLIIGFSPWIYNKVHYYRNTTRPFQKFWGSMFSGGLSIITTVEEREQVIKSQVLDYLAINDAEQVFKGLYPNKYHRYTCDENTRGMLNGNLLLVGGPIANDITSVLMKRVSLRYVFRDHEIIDTTTNSLICKATQETGMISEDYGIITRQINPYNKSKKVIMVTGCYGWGTWAALEALLEPKNMNFLSEKRAEFYQVLVSVNIHSRIPGVPILKTDTFVNLEVKKE
jgi:hypothetical protein